MKKINEFFKDLSLTPAQLQTLGAYVDLIWQKKDDMNLTSVSDKQEIWNRHIADGLAAARLIKKLGAEDKTAADIGAGAGYIGITIAVALPWIKIILIESLEKRCAFLRWTALKLGLKNVSILNERARAGEHEKYDYALERAMGKFEDVLPIVLSYVKPAGRLIAFQSAEVDGFTAEKYFLPDENKPRFLIIKTAV
ncbi:MAG: 16S rRNA (guanine(527)-N(7))-methyltransferase RsmG [Elusimicrobium sp.]|jgi:16S rRNA (guanine527-N7)-methyltransferase|nr:16S rRNA (guanine(527)-N(7))-methyltransferase RsmG [Elusimicrobium sp.]